MSYPTNEVTLFLSQSFPYASRRFAEENVKNDMSNSLTTERWFRNYFPSERAFELHEKMERWIINRQWFINQNA